MSGNCRNPKVETEVCKRYHEIVDELLDEDVVLHKKIKVALIPPEAQAKIKQLQAENKRLKEFEDDVWGIIGTEPLREAGYKIMELLE